MARDRIGAGGPVFRTERLLLRALREGDLAALAEMNADAETMAYIGGPIDRAASDDFARQANRAFAEAGHGMIAVERRSDGAFLGACGLSRVPWYPDELEIGWRLARPHWGRGFATEAAGAWLVHAFGRLHAPRLISVADAPNARSIAVMRRLGMRFDHRATLQEGDSRFEAVIHSLTAEDWRQRAATRR